MVMLVDISWIKQKCSRLVFSWFYNCAVACVCYRWIVLADTERTLQVWQLIYC